MSDPRADRSLFFQALAVDDTLPIDPEAAELWLRDLESPLRWSVLPLLRFLLSIQLHLTWLLKRLLPWQFSAHRTLQALICWFCEHFVSPEANVLILRHYTTESNLINFLIDNGSVQVRPLTLYPLRLEEMLEASFVDHDQELFRSMRDLGSWREEGLPLRPEQLNWEHWRPMEIQVDPSQRRWTQVLDFETAHVLFMSLFCLLLTRSEYRDAINGFHLDQSIAKRIGRILGDSSLVDMAYNKYPLYLVGPWNLTQRFLMHGFFTEHLYAHLERIRQETLS